MKLSIRFLYLSVEFLADKWYLFLDLAIYSLFFVFCLYFSFDRLPLTGACTENGYKHSRGSVEGSLVLFSCANGYSLEGNKYLEGDENG